jgi:hypothetical protein
MEVTIGLGRETEAKFFLRKTIGKVLLDDMFNKVQRFCHSLKFKAKNTSIARKCNLLEN